MRERVGHQVAQHLAKPSLVAKHLWRTRPVEDLEPDGALWSNGFGVVHGIAGYREQIDRLPFQRTLRIEAGEQQQVLHQQSHPGGLTLDAPIKRCTAT